MRAKSIQNLRSRRFDLYAHFQIVSDCKFTESQDLTDSHEISQSEEISDSDSNGLIHDFESPRTSSKKSLVKTLSKNDNAREELR